MIKAISILAILILLLPTTIPAQNWVSDSLQIVKDQIEEEIKNENYDKVQQIFTYLSGKGSSSLDQQIFDYMYTTIKRDEIKNQPALLGLIANNLGNMEFYRGDMMMAKNRFEEALIYYQAAKQKKDAAGMAMNLGIIQERLANYDSALINYDKALPIFLEFKDFEAAAICFENQAIVYNYMGNSSKSLALLNKTDSLLNEILNDGDGRFTNLYYNKSIVFMELGNFDSSIYYAFKGLKISENLEDDRRKNIGYIQLQDIYKRMGDDENWLKYVDLAKQFAEKTGNEMRLAELNFSLSSYYNSNGLHDSAEYFIKKATPYYVKENVGEGLAKSYLLMGSINYEKGDFDKAVNYFKLSLNNIVSIDSKTLASIYHNLGKSFIKIKQYDSSDYYLQKALEKRLSFKELESISETYKRLSESSQDQGNFQSALDYFQLHKQYEDSVYNKTKTEQIAKIQTEYETEKKDQSIAALEQDKEIQTLKASKQQSQIYLSLVGLALVLIVAFVFFYRYRVKQKANKALAAKNTEIEEQNKEKEMLLKEIHHRVKNNLQIISSLLSMQTRTLSDSKTIDVMKESQSRVKTMALIHEKLYQYDNLARINMNDYMRQLSDFLTQTYNSEKDINVVIESEDINLDIDTAVPLGLITNELLSNALKYAFEDMERGQISIQLLRDISGNYTLTISDTGKGLAKDMDIEKSKSLGLKLVRTLTRQINGNLSISSNPGATFSIVFSENRIAA